MLRAHQTCCKPSAFLQGEQNPKLIERITNFDMGSISVVTLAQLTRLVAEPEFNIVQVCYPVTSKTETQEQKICSRVSASLNPIALLCKR